VFSLIKEKSFFRGRITLASGKESDFYFDMKPTMLSPCGAATLSKLIFDRLYAMPVDYVGGLAVGAIPLVACVVMFSDDTGRPLPGFFVRKEVKNHGTKRVVEGLPEGETLEGKNVVILDDVTTTGGSAMIAVDAAKSAAAKVILVLSVVDRQEGASEFYKAAGVPFESLFTASEFLNG
jgi:orotate phosphoribosyltransferase